MTRPRLRILATLLFILSVFPQASLHPRAYSPRVVSEHVADWSGDWHSFMQHQAFIGKRNHELAVAVWKYLCSPETGIVHTGSWDEPCRTTDASGKPDPWGNMFTYWTIYDPVKQMNSFGMGYCGMQSTALAGIFTALGYESRAVNLNHGYSHQVAEVFYDGAWHFLDADERGVVLTPGGELASWAQMVAHPEWWPHRPFEDAPHFPDHLRRFGGLVKEGKVAANAYKYRWAPQGHTMDFVLRMGESFTRWWCADSTRYYKGWWNRSDNAGDWLRNHIAEDPEHMYTYRQGGEYGSIYDRPGMGVFRYRPALGKGWLDYADGVYADSNVVLDDSGIICPGGRGYTMFNVYTPWIIIGRNGPDPGAAPPADGVVVEYRGQGRITLFLSPDFGVHWDKVAEGPSNRVDLTGRLYGRWGYLVRFELGGNSRIDQLGMTTWVQVAPVSLPAVRGQTKMRFRTGDRTGEKTVVQPWIVDLCTTRDSLEARQWLTVENHSPMNLSHRADRALARLAQPPGTSFRWLTVGGDFNNHDQPEVWVSTTGQEENLRLLARLTAPQWCDHWMSRLDEFLGPPDAIPGDLLVEYRKNVNNIRIYAHCAEPDRPVKNSPVKITHCVGGALTSLTADSDTTYTVRGQGDNQWVSMEVASQKAEKEN